MKSHYGADLSDLSAMHQQEFADAGGFAQFILLRNTLSVCFFVEISENGKKKKLIRAQEHKYLKMIFV